VDDLCAARRGIDIESYPSVMRHLEGFRTQLEPKPEEWRPRHKDDKWPGRKEGTYAWYEIQDSVDYWEEFQKPKIIYQVIQFFSSYAFDDQGRFGNDKTFILPTDRLDVLAALNAPIMWWFNWRKLPHLKDEALSPMGYLMEHLPLTPWTEDLQQTVAISVQELMTHRTRIGNTAITTNDWLRHEFGLDKPGTALSAPHLLDADGFAAAARKALPKSRKLSAGDIARLKQEHAETIEPARTAAMQALALERQLSDLVNTAYGLTPEDVKLMWETAPPRMPFTP
jgi:hypothetical protein